MAKNYEVATALRAVNPPKLWHVYLSEKGKKDSYMEVHVNPEDGRIIYFSLSDYQDKTTLASTEREAKKLALSFVKGVFSEEEFKQLYILPIEKRFQGGEGSYHEFQFRRSFRGYPFADDRAKLTVRNGKVTHYELIWTKVPNEQSGSVFGPDKAAEVFHTKVGLELGYVLSKVAGSKEEVWEPRLAYYPRVRSGYIDPYKGEVFLEYGYPYVPTGEILGPMGKENPTIKRDKEVTQEEALKIAEEFVSLPSKYKLKSSSKTLYNQWEFRWGVAEDYNDYITMSVDIKTGEVHRYYAFRKNSESKELKVTEAQAKQIALTYIKNAIPSQLHRIADIKEGNSDNSELRREYYFQFPMILNGLPFRNQTVSVSVNGEGVVTSYEARIWSGEAPKLEIPIAKREIDLIFNRRFLKPLAYIVWSPHDEPVLGYRIGERYSDFFFIEATTGLVRRPDGFGYEATSLILETSKHWAGPEIKRLISMGVISPVYENFVSNELVTRGQFVRYLARAIKISPLYPEGDAFSDVTRENTDFGYIEAVAEVNIVLGSNGKFSPSGNITREEVAVILARILAEAEPAEIGQKEFKDAGTIASWAKEGVKVAVSKGLIKGDQRGNFNPKNNVTQAELAVMLSRLIDSQEF